MTEKHKAGFMPWDRSGNRVIVQSQLGKNKPTNYEIPDDHFTYGRQTCQDPEKACNLMYGWQYHNNTQNPNIDKTKDIIETNKQALKNLACNSSTNYNFRKSQTQYKKVKEGKKDVKIYLPQENFTYGKAEIIEDPIKHVLANQYGQVEKFFRHTMYQSSIDNENRGRKILSCHITKNHNLAKQKNSKRIADFDWNNRRKNQWKLSKFTNTSQKVSTTRQKDGFCLPQRITNNQ